MGNFKLLTLILAAALCLPILAACNDGTPEVPVDTTVQTTAPDVQDTTAADTTMEVRNLQLISYIEDVED